MASAFKRGKTWIAKYKDHRGVQVSLRTKCQGKTETLEFARDLEKKAQRQRLGLEPMPAGRPDRTVGELVAWWLDHHSVKSPSHDRNKSTLEKHLLGREGVYARDGLAKVRLRDLTSGRINAWLNEKELGNPRRGVPGLQPQTLNHLRMYLVRAWSAAVEHDWWSGKNPALGAAVRKVPKRMPSFLTPEEAPAFLRAAHPWWRPFFAAALYTGMRQGELAGLLKSEVLLRQRLIIVGHSYERDRPKGGDEAPIPIAADLVPFLEEAIARSSGAHVFTTLPRRHGQPGRSIPRTKKFDLMVRAALRRAGIVTGYRHHCRRKGCGVVEEHPDPELRRCPRCAFKMLAVGVPKRLRFHDLRHTTASLLLMEGAPLIVVSRVLRHSDPRITNDVYGHLVPGWLQGEIDRLRLTGPKPLPAPTLPRDGAPVVREEPSPAEAGSTGGEKPKA